MKPSSKIEIKKVSLNTKLTQDFLNQLKNEITLF